MTKLYRHILVATDLAKRGNSVIKKAHELAVEFDAKLSIAHVVSHTPIAYAGEFAMPANIEFMRSIVEQAEKALEKVSQKYEILPRSQHVLQGSVKLEITALAKKIKANLIVIGTHPQEGLERLLGSQADAILHTAHCDVLVVRTK